MSPFESVTSVWFLAIEFNFKVYLGCLLFYCSGSKSTFGTGVDSLCKCHTVWGDDYRHWVLVSSASFLVSMVAPNDLFIMISYIETDLTHAIDVWVCISPIIKLFKWCIPIVIEIGLVVSPFLVRFLFNATF